MYRICFGILCCVTAGCFIPAQAALPPLLPDTPLQGCPVDPGPDLPDLPPLDPSDPRIEVLTGHAEVDLNAGTAFSDQIRIRRGEGVLTAPGAHFDRDTGEFTMDGGLEYRDPQASITGKHAEFDTGTNQVRVTDAEFRLFAIPSRGTASSITLEDSNLLRLKDVTYTTCARGKDEWLLRASKVEIDRDGGVATARNARLEFKGVPILYTPWISYPVTNQRKSGFLLPGIGRSETRGLEFQIPYYLNLAPNYDATLTPRYMSDRGVELISEVRYLWPDHKGTFDAEYLPNDNATGDNRYLFGLSHQSLLGGGWRATLDGKAVSDTRYFEDLYGTLSATSQTHLERVLDFEHMGDYWTVLARFQDYQTLDESLTDAEKPYRRVPEISVNGYLPRGPLRLSYRLDSELTVFDRNVGVTGERLHIGPEISLPLRYRGFSLEPAAAFEYTGYNIDNPDPGTPDHPGAAVPVYSIDLGTVLERGARGETGWLQTLEPRMQFVYIPFTDQSDLPVFDTIEPDFNMVQLFRKNRFLGYDRIGDTNQLNIGLTTRLLDAANGTQFLTATIGETRFFSEQNVTLPGGTPVDNKSSDWLAELALNFWDHWKMDLGYQWNSDSGQSERTQARLQYRRDGRHIVNFGYRYRRDTLEEVDLSAAWPIGDRWSAVGRYDYSIHDREPLERFIGFQYETCCWGVRLVYRRYLATRDGQSDTALSFQLVLKGLTNVGDPADRLLERGILGYEPD